MNTKTLTRTLLCVMLVAFVGGLTSCKSKQAEEQLKKAPAPERQEWDRFSLYGDVAKVTCKEDGVVNDIYYFNANGDVSKHEDYSDGELSSRATFRYDSAGNKIEEAYYNSSGELTWRYTYRYDSAGNLIEKVVGELYERETYRYDSAGNKIEWVRYNSDGVLVERCTYRYDSAGNMIESVQYYPDGEVAWRYTYEIEYR